MQQVQTVAGETLLHAKPFHLMLSRFWKGDWRVPVVEGKRVLGYASGISRAGAQKQAENLIADAAVDGLHWHARAPGLAGNLEQDMVNLRGITLEDTKTFGNYLNKGAPGTATHRRLGANFYVGYNRPLDQKEMEGAVLRQLQRYQQYQAKLTAKTLLKDDLNRLRATDIGTYSQVVDRINKTFGEEGKFSEAINKAADVVLSPYLGKNSASKIVGAANKYMFRWTLGFWNIGYNIANSLTFIQTAYPQIAMLSTAAPEELMKYYTYWPLKGATRRGAVGMLDMFKLTGQSFLELGNPGKDLRGAFERAAQEGVWDPRFIEEFVGQKSSMVRNLSGVLHGDAPVGDWFSAVADYLPSTTEKFARGHSFVLGHIFFRDLMGVKDPEMLYQLSKQFVENTQFLYSTGDRANIITGPVGSALGLFKNWIMHYIGWMAAYTNEGMLRGNWSPLLWLIGSSTAIGGAAATPMWLAANTMSKMFNNKSAMVNLYGMYAGDKNKTIADSVMYGLPAFMGFSIQNQVSMPGANPGQDASQLFSLAYMERLKFMARAGGAAIDEWLAAGNGPAKSQHVRDLFMRALAPRSIYRVTQTTKAGVVRSLSSSYPVTSGLTATQKYMFDLGLNPVTISRAYRVQDELWAKQDAMQNEIQSLGTAWAQAMQSDDQAAMDTIITRAVLENVDVSSVLKSGQARLAKGREDAISRQFSPQAVMAYRQAGVMR